MKKTKKVVRETIKIELSEPIEWGEDNLVEVLEMKRPKAKHLRKLPASPSMGDMINLAGKLCGQPNSLMDELSLEDLNKVTEALESFF